jgi:hypothetical protein
VSTKVKVKTNVMLFFLSLISLLGLVSGSPALVARQLPSALPTGCPYDSVPTVSGNWIAAATNVAAIPQGDITQCQLGCLGKFSYQFFSLGKTANLTRWPTHSKRTLLHCNYYLARLLCSAREDPL